MRKTLLSVVGLLFLFSVIDCSSADQAPLFRVRNEFPAEVSIQIQTSGGNTININNVATDSTSNYRSVEEGNVGVTVKFQSLPDLTTNFTAGKNTLYTIAVQADTSVRIRNP